ncbi:MAG: SMC-Scp complex subunit ScpB [Ruminococcaceae bacterium]|nr:SMC-Scp complex subunit ScpB [Oscillospiraceae bacterium]
MIAMAEAILFAAAEPLEYTKIAAVMGLDDDTMLSTLDELTKKLDSDDSGVCLVRMDTKYQLCSKKEFVEPIRSILDLKRNSPLSQAAFEVLAIIAYNQPITKPYIEQIRGVDCSGVVNTLCQRELVEEKGRLDVPGRPVLYGTTANFLRCFSMSSLDELPELPTADREVLMSDVDNGQLSMFDGVGEDESEGASDPIQGS